MSSILAEAIRSKVQQVCLIESVFGQSRLATIEDAPTILVLLSDERVLGDVYTLPRPFSLESINTWIKGHEAQARQGEGLLMIVEDEHGKIVTLTDFQFWPQYAACEFGGVIAAHLQSRHIGTKGIKELCDWVFAELSVQLLVMTASAENIRTHKLLGGLGFKPMDEMDSVRPDGTVRR